MACEAVLLQRQGDDVGRLVRGLRSVDSAQGISAASGDNRAGGGRTPWSGFSVSIQHVRAVRHAVADVYERCDKQRQPVWKQRLLDGKSARDVYGARGVSGLRQADWQPFGGIPEMGEASHCGCVLRRHGAEPGAIQTDERADPYDHRTLRRRSAGCVHILQAAHAVWNRYGTAEAKAKHFLIIGPWDHAGTRTPKAEVGGLKFGQASLVDLNKLHTEWYDWAMKSGTKPEFLKQRVAYYVVGAEEWKYADSLESISNVTKTLYLGSGGGAGDVFRSGALTEENSATSTGTDSWTYDPLATKPGSAEPEDDGNSLTSQRAVVNLFGEGVIYYSEIFPENTEIAGFPKLTVWLKMDVPDTDLEADLYEILPDGGSVALTGASMRARYRESLREAKPVVPGKIEKYVFDNFTFFARRIGKGSRLRLVVRSINSTGSEKNYNSGGVVAAESGKDAKTAHISLVHDKEHPGALELPVVKP